MVKVHRQMLCPIITFKVSGAEWECVLKKLGL